MQKLISGSVEYERLRDLDCEVAVNVFGMELAENYRNENKNAPQGVYITRRLKDSYKESDWRWSVPYFSTDPVKIQLVIDKIESNGVFEMEFHRTGEYNWFFFDRAKYGGTGKSYGEAVCKAAIAWVGAQVGKIVVEGK